MVTKTADGISPRGGAGTRVEATRQEAAGLLSDAQLLSAEDRLQELVERLGVDAKQVGCVQAEDLGFHRGRQRGVAVLLLEGLGDLEGPEGHDLRLG